MARIEGRADRGAGLLARYGFRVARKKTGQVPEPLRIMAHSRGLLMAAGGFEMGLERMRSIDARLKGLASLKAASLIGCVF